MRRTLSLAMLAIGASAFSQTMPLFGFHEIPGVQEFSGRLIARPAQIPDMLNKGMSVREAVSRQNAAIKSLGSMIIRHVPQTDEYILKVPAGQTTNSLAAKLSGTLAFQYVEPDWIVYPTDAPNDPLLANWWNLTKVQAIPGWDMYHGDQTDIIIAICDTGLRLTHEEMVGHLVPGANSASGTAVPQSGNNVNDVHGHGTHTAGTAAASGNNAKGGSGMGWSMKLMPVRITDSSSGNSSISAMTAGAIWAADNGARVVSCSYSGVTSSAIGSAGTYLRSKNCLYFFAAGNDAANLGSSVDWPNVEIIGATTPTDAKASFSAYGIALDCFAPGTDIWSSYYTSNSAYTTMSGTSMATPCAAGTGALLTASNPGMTSYDVENSLFQGCDNIGSSNTFGWGRVNVNKALRYAYMNYPFYVNSYSMTHGSGSGAASNLKTSDNSYVSLTGVRTATARLVIPTTLRNPNNVTLTIEDASTQGYPVSLKVICETPGGDVTVNGGTTNGTDNTRTITLPNALLNQSTRTSTIRLEYTNVPIAIIESDRLVGVRIDRATLMTKPL